MGGFPTRATSTLTAERSRLSLLLPLGKSLKALDPDKGPVLAGANADAHDQGDADASEVTAVGLWTPPIRHDMLRQPHPISQGAGLPDHRYRLPCHRDRRPRRRAVVNTRNPQGARQSMPVQHALWKMDAVPERLASGLLDSEKQLEEMIVAAPEILSSDWMLIGRQERTSYGKIVDLLAVAPDGSLVLIELKRGKTPWDVVAQALDYASWVEQLEAGDIADIYRRFTDGSDLAEDFKKHSGGDLDEEQLNQTHQIVIIAEGSGRLHRAHYKIPERTRCTHQRSVLPGVHEWEREAAEPSMAHGPERNGGGHRWRRQRAGQSGTVER